MRLVKSFRETGRKSFKLLGEAKRKRRARAIARRRALARKLAARRGPVVMSTAEAYEEYTALTRPKAAQMNQLTARFDALYDRMQAPAARAGLREAFAATPEALGKSAVAAARQRTA